MFSVEIILYMHNYISNTQIAFMYMYDFCVSDFICMTNKFILLQKAVISLNLETKIQIIVMWFGRCIKTRCSDTSKI